ncbi:hypothetical protein EK21DRAFT_84772 [Setomelanomma holmii]|uniref:Uncharacterized protein n=1 Tax=Setomelanomma holmii TaxID=210430 RepID=A0A9P4LS66_9PLEO|nr:hypothetical protein EK21DRAFT_84772 [Setomelanomma holmii]
MRSQPVGRPHFATVSRASDVQLWFIIETLSNPAVPYRKHAGRTNTRPSAGWRRRVSTSGSSVSCPISGSSPKAITLRSTRGAPLRRKDCMLEFASCRYLILGRRRVEHYQQQPHTLGHLPRFSSPGHHCSLVRCMHMQATQLDGGPQSAFC